jgi:hypothetical protein
MIVVTAIALSISAHHKVTFFGDSAQEDSRVMVWTWLRQVSEALDRTLAEWKEGPLRGAYF